MKSCSNPAQIIIILAVVGGSQGTRDPNYNPKIAIEVRRLTSRFNLQLFRSFWMAYIESIGNVQ